MVDPPKLNRHGRKIWFRQHDAGAGAYAPTGSKGCLAFVLAGCWLLVSAVIGMALILRWHSPSAVTVMFAIGAPGLILFGVIVRRHS